MSARPGVRPGEENEIEQRTKELSPASRGNGGAIHAVGASERGSRKQEGKTLGKGVV